MTTADNRPSPSLISDVVNPLTGLPGATPLSRRGSVSSDAATPVSIGLSRENSKDSNRHTRQNSNKDSNATTASIPLPRTATPGLVLTTSSPEAATASRLGQDGLPANPLVPGRRQSSSDSQRQYQSAEQLASRLPPHLQALRSTSHGPAVPSSPFSVSPVSSPEAEVSPRSPANPNGIPPLSATSGTSSSSRKLSMLVMTPTESSGRENVIATSGPPILVNPKCSGYFVEPLRWMEPVLKNGEIGGKLVCPNEKCGVKIGNFDWAGVQCGCKEWVTPGFCIHRSKVDEVW